MKKEIIIYSVFVFIFLIALGFFTMSETIIRQQNALNDEIFLEAKTTKSFDRFVKYQSSYYLLIDQEEIDGFKFTTYQIITNENENHHLLIVVPVEDVKYAEEKTDVNDKTKVVLTTPNHSFNTNIYNEALSFGYNENQVGFMFFNIKTDKDDTLNIKYYDYNNTLIIDKDFGINGDVDFDNLSNDFEKGYTIVEIETMMNIDEVLRPLIFKRIAIYLVITISIPFIYKLVKTLALKINTKNNRK